MKKIELLAPAGNIEKLKTAVIYGADAVYFGGEDFSLRAAAGNFSFEEMKEGIRFCHERGVKCYLTINIFPHNDDIRPLELYLLKIRNIGIDGFIVSDLGMYSVLREVMADARIHVSTQANVTNYRSAGVWERMGASRIVLARELSLEEIRAIRENISPELELEAFCHGAMCMSYSGRCMLSKFMTGRDANRGECAHPCRYRYALVEEKRPDEYWPIEEDERGTYIMNSGDLCMIEHIREMAEAGISCFKIEGRMKSVFYVATIVGAYRKAIDDYEKGLPFDKKLLEEVSKVSHRKFTTGFYFGEPSEDESGREMKGYAFLGIVKSYDEKTMQAKIEQRGKMSVGDEIEIFGPGEDHFTQRIETMTDEEGRKIDSAPHARQTVYMKMKRNVSENFILRKEN